MSEKQARYYEFIANGDVNPAHLIEDRDSAFAIYCAAKPETDDHCEDFLGLIHFPKLRSSVFAVADGAGGHPAGEVAAKIAIESVIAKVAEAERKDLPLRFGILDAFTVANELIRAMGKGSASTLVVAERQGDQVRFFHAGDSVAMIIGQRGKLKYRTMDHSPFALGIEAGFLKEKDRGQTDVEHIVTNLVGAADMRIEVSSPFKLDPKDTVVLASDGLIDNIKLPKILDQLSSGDLKSELDKVALLARDAMLDEDRDLSKIDDLSVVMFRQN